MQPRTETAVAAPRIASALRVSDRKGSANAALAGLALAILLPSLATSVANVALPDLAHRLGASFQAAQWVVLAYLLAITTLIVVAGQLGDRIGRRRLLLIGIALFTIASLLCGLAPTLGTLITARVAQGLGAAIMMALTIAFVGDVVPKARMGRAMGLLGTMSAIGTTLGPSLGGLLIASAGWRAIFLVNVPLGLLALFIVRRALPADGPSQQSPQGFDVIGIVLLAATLGAYALAMTIGRGTFGRLSIGLLAAAFATGGCFLLVEARSRAPLIQLVMFRDKALGAGLLANALVSTVMMATLVVGPFFLSRGLRFDPATVGLALSVGPLVAALAGMPAGRLVDQAGPRRSSLAGLAIVTAGSLALSLIHTDGLASYLAPIIVMTSGYALFQAANTAAIMADAPAAQRSTTAGLLSLSRNLGLVTGASAMGAVFAFGVAGDVITAAPQAIFAGLRLTFGAAAGLVVVGLVLTLAARQRRTGEIIPLIGNPAARGSRQPDRMER